MGGNVMFPGDAAWIMFGVFFTLLVLRVPVAEALGLGWLPAYDETRRRSSRAFRPGGWGRS